jgi:glutamyl-tRNA reductase
MQGSLLERAMQSVFKTHKRISNETEFRDGTTSVAYKSLKVVSTTYKGDHATTKKILLIGSGDIVRQLLKYNTKFNFSNVHISNRTRDKAEWLASQYGCALYDWNKVLENQFADFDVIISAAGNCHHLIKEIEPSKRTRLLIDLALPGNIDASLAKLERVLFYDLDTISSELEDTKDKRISAIGKVNDLIDEELRVYVDWYKEAPLRAFLAAYKIVLSQKVEAFYETQPVAYNEQDIVMVTERVMRKLLKKDLFSLSDNALEAIIKTQVHQDYAMC